MNRRRPKHIKVDVTDSDDLCDITAHRPTYETLSFKSDGLHFLEKPFDVGRLPGFEKEWRAVSLNGTTH